MPDAVLLKQAESILQRCKAKGFMMSTAESCTGGMLGALFTEIPGSSAAYEGGVVSYSNTLKHHLLGVPQELLDQHGAVSKQAAEHMARGMQAKAGSDIAISVTGIAGPGGGTAEKPVGLVY
ncbi:MAG: CinA family protein, partial [Alphaproteobacteria bacterium]